MKNPDRIYKKIIRSLSRGEERTQKELSELLSVSAASISRALGKLETEGLVERREPRFQGERGEQRQVESFCVGRVPLLVIVRMSHDRKGFKYVSMNFDGSDRREEHIFFRAELSFDDNCKAAVSEVALRLRLLKTSGKRVALGVIDEESRYSFWKSIGADIVTSERGMALLLGEMRGGVGCYLEVISPDNVRVSVLLDGKEVCNPKAKSGDDISSAAELAAVMNIENVFVFASSDDDIEVLAEEKLRSCFAELDRPVRIVNCGASEQENILKALLAEKAIDLLI